MKIRKIVDQIINERNELEGFEEIETRPKKIIKLTEQDLETLLTGLLGQDLKSLLTPNMKDSPLSKISTDSSDKIPKDILDKIKKGVNPFGDSDQESDLNQSGGPSTNMSTNFNDMIEKIIDNFEGGYYDPKTMKNAGMGDSGETMYGMDAKASDMLKTAEGVEFWNLIHNDRKKNPECYKLEYDPAKGKGKCYNPTLAKKLKLLIAQIMKPSYDDFSRRYLSPEALKIVNNDPGLLFNFTYAVWNGPGWFQKFAKVINDEVKSGNKNPKKLLKIAIDTRKNWSSSSSFANNLIRRSGRDMEKILMA